MTNKERVEATLERERKNRENGTCENCRHFHRHYVRINDRGVIKYVPIYEGHCSEPRIKLRLLDDRCERYERKKLGE